MLVDIIRHIDTRGPVTLGQLATHFDVAADVIEPMLDRLVAKGRLRRLEPTADGGCPGCRACASAGSDAVVFAPAAAEGEPNG